MVKQRYLIAIGLSGFVIVYLAVDFISVAHFYYLPTQGSFRLGHPPIDTIAMSYWGQILWGILGSAVSVILAALLPKISEKVAVSWAIGFCLLAVAYFLWGLWPF